MQKIWISGVNGQIGYAIKSVVDNLEYEIFETDKKEVDVTDLDKVLAFSNVNRPDIIINCSGITNIKVCEENPKDAFRVNALGARNLSIAASNLNAKLVQISTDDVFDGRSIDSYNEFDVTHPISIYGKSKLAGENYVKEFTNRHFIIRSTWVYGIGSNFVKSLLEKAEEEEAISVASDQFGAPTSARELAKFILYIIGTKEYGTYHATCKGTCSRYAFAKEILRLAGKKNKVKAVPTRESDFTTVMPAYAVLDNFIIGLNGNYHFAEWKAALAEYMREEGHTNE